MTRYLTPDSVLPGKYCRVMHLPRDPDQWGIIDNALFELTKDYNWVKFGNISQADAARYFTKLMLDYLNSTQECGDRIGGDCDDTGRCQELLPRNQIIQFQPYNPFIEPEKVVDPYPKPIWTRGENEWIPGALPTDVLFTFKAFLDNPLDIIEWVTGNFLDWAWDELTDFDNWFGGADNLFPRFKIEFQGKGTVDLHLLKVPAGGLAYVTLDGNPNGRFVPLTTFSFIEVESWLSGLAMIGLGAAAGSLVQTEIIQIAIESEGNHYIDVTFIPKIEVSFPELAAIGWGGGLRKIEMCGVMPIPAPPITRENTAKNCIEWLNPLTAQWQCIAPICPPANGMGDYENEECECDDMANCSKCGQNVVRFCDGKLVYTDSAGVEQQVPPDAIPDPKIPQPDPEETPTQDNACYKVNGLWVAFEAMIDALLESQPTGVLRVGAAWYADLQKNHANVDWDNTNLYQFTYGHLDDSKSELTAAWADEMQFIKDTIICQMWSGFDKSATLSTGNLQTFKNSLPLLVADVDLKAYITDALKTPEVMYWKTAAHAAAVAEDGECNCGQGGVVIPDIPEGCYKLEFEQFTGAWTHVYPNGVPTSLTAARALTPVMGAKSGGVYNATKTYDSGNDASNYICSIIMKFSTPVTYHGGSSRMELSSGANYAVADLYGHAGADADDWLSLDANNEYSSPSTAINVTWDGAGETVEHLMLQFVASYEGNVTKTAKVKDIRFDVTVGGQRFTLVLPEIAFCPD